MNTPDKDLMPGDTIPIEPGDLILDLHQTLQDRQIAYQAAGQEVATSHHRLFDFVREKHPELKEWDFQIGLAPAQIRLIRSQKKDRAEAAADFAELRAKAKKFRDEREARKNETPPAPPTEEKK